MRVDSRPAQYMERLSRLMVRAYCENGQRDSPAGREQLHLDLCYVATLTSVELADFLALADTHHVVVRALTVLQHAATVASDARIADWCEGALAAEQARIDRAVAALQTICQTLESRDCKAAVIKSLDHWPDLGSDLDLYTIADEHCIAQVMREEFNASAVERSWGDRLANKWNYSVPGLPELVEIHIRFLGQTGEHAQMARRVVECRVLKVVAGREFYVPAPEERIVISALQRVYRHFYFRLCDMIDFASLLQSGSVRYDELRRAADCAGIWPGVATFLVMIQSYVQSYGGLVSLPEDVVASAGARSSRVRFKDGFLRVSKAAAAGLYSSQLLQAGLRHDMRALVRLPLLPPLAFSALVAHSLTGNDKGIW